MPDIFLRHIDSPIQADYERFVFNTPVFLNQFRDLSIQSFYLFDTDRQKLKAEIHFIVKDQVAYSLWRASFGSYQFATDVNESDLLNFHLQTEKALLDLQVKKILIRNYPQAYATEQAMLVEKLLISQNYTQLYSDWNYHLNVRETFGENLRQSEKTRLKLLSKKDFKTEYWANPDLEELYQVLLQNRQTQGYTMSMDFENFEAMFIALPRTYTAFRTVYNQKTIAVAVCVHINNEVLYNFYIGELPEYRKFSPVVGLLKHIHDFAMDNNYRILDLGIASVGGELNLGLARFKENMGGKMSGKGMFEKVVGEDLIAYKTKAA
jgi:hypothetical protein